MVSQLTALPSQRMPSWRLTVSQLTIIPSQLKPCWRLQNSANSTTFYLFYSFWGTSPMPSDKTNEKEGLLSLCERAAFLFFVPGTSICFLCWNTRELWRRGFRGLSYLQTVCYTLPSRVLFYLFFCIPFYIFRPSFFLSVLVAYSDPGSLK